MQRTLKLFTLTAILAASSAHAEDLHIKFSVVDYYNNAQKIDWQSGWSQMEIYATGPDGTIFYPEREGDTFILPVEGTYIFDGRGAYVCGLVHNQKVEITRHIVEIRLFGWCE